ncbi:hypothetical protein BS50DRAFT_568707 [Corynespora cassiicola Philippines]|uniref:Uncharacterized protein n=1 Tax=Corynespora cassiicola Philippines TaxID=1448308 RepID=A0A2T2P6I1_CORCC|nr:hypothetical protein BS50DRAFT_568707 [Corynespora cassiicola Philippines]
MWRKKALCLPCSSHFRPLYILLDAVLASPSIRTAASFQSRQAGVSYMRVGNRHGTPRFRFGPCLGTRCLCASIQASRPGWRGRAGGARDGGGRMLLSMHP